MADPDHPIYIDTKDRSKFFQTIQAWPLDEDLNYDGWLKNFAAGDDRNLACNILDFFNYYSVGMVNHMLKASVAKAGYFFKNHFTDWQHSDFNDRCVYSYIPGESPNPTDSGNLFARKLRDEVGIPQGRIVEYSRLYEALNILAAPTPIVFVDDFVGTGQQVRKAWKVNPFDKGLTLEQICNAGGHCAVYAPLIVNSIGYDVIKNECIGLNLSTIHVLGSEYCLFDPKCICWKNDIDLYNKGVELILRKSKENGIPSTNGGVVTDEKGYLKQGLAISFEHGAPDAIIPLFYWNSDNWTPLIRKQYDR